MAKKPQEPDTIQDAELPNVAAFEALANIPGGLGGVLRKILEGFLLQEKLFLYKGTKKVGFIEMTFTQGAVPPIDDTSTIRIVGLNPDTEAETQALVLTQSVQVSGEQYSFSAPGISVSFGSTNGEAKLELTNASVTRAVRVAYTSNGEPHVFLDNLPTSDPSIAGALWNNGGVVTIS